MTRSLMTGITGLRTHQQKLDVVANNLANMNTIGFKSQATNFSDLMYNTLRSASGASTTSGGINPDQIGTGVQVANITRSYAQGTLQSTGEVLDFGLNGDGFFVLSGQTGENLFTRAGSFSVDGEGRLVDPSTGFLVQRFGDVGEPDSSGFGFQVPGDSSIRIPLGAAVPGDPTESIGLDGNLPSRALPPSAEVLSSFAVFETGSGAATLATALDDLTINQANYVAGDQITLNGTQPDGTPFSTTVAASGGTVGDVVNALNSTLVDATATLAADGTLQITSDNPGEAFLGLVIDDDAGNVGGSSFSSNSMVVTTEGTNGESFELSMEVYDARGDNHRLTFEFVKESTNTWSVTVDIPTSSGTMIDNQIADVTFNEDGSFSLVGGTGAGDANIEIDFATMSTPTTIEIDFSSLSHYATGYSLTPSQDGFPPGNLTSVATSSNGEIVGLASNGRTIPLAQLALASFTNNGGLDAVGGNYFEQSLNSGIASIGEGMSGGRGQVIGGQLEGSNVDIAQEFTQLIVAQRGFSANARTITVADEILEELNNIVR